MCLITKTLALAGLLFTRTTTYAQSTTASYNGPLRPQIHFSPPSGFMNDPNGMFVDAQGLHHLYYQLNPNDTIAGNQHWGHATSMDLYHWTNQPIALSPANDTEYIFSGSAVVDVNNTSGFFPNQTDGVVALYTLSGPVQQVQDVAYSTDGGYTFTKYSGNPVLSADSLNFRDPKVFWHAETERWVMVVAYSQDYTIGIFTSTNLTMWTHASNFTHAGLLGQQYECPNMVAIPTLGPDGSAVSGGKQMYLMYISINPGAPLGGSVAEYFPGTFNGTHFTPVDRAARIADFGKDNYAGQFFSGYPGTEKQVSIAWASNWEYCNYVPTGPTEGWQSAMSLPRENWLRYEEGGRMGGGWELVSVPYKISAVLPSQPLLQNSSMGNGTLFVDFANTGESGSLVISVSATGLNVSELSTTSSINITILSSMSGESLTLGQFFNGGAFWMDRGHTSGFENVYFTDKMSTAVLYEDAFDMQIFVDRSLWEVFLLGGRSSATMTFFPEEMLDTVVVRTGGVNEGAVVGVEIWQVESAWKGDGVAAKRNSTMDIRRNLVGI